ALDRRFELLGLLALGLGQRVPLGALRVRARRRLRRDAARDLRNPAIEPHALLVSRVPKRRNSAPRVRPHLIGMRCATCAAGRCPRGDSLRRAASALRPANGTIARDALQLARAPPPLAPTALRPARGAPRD